MKSCYLEDSLGFLEPTGKMWEHFSGRYIFKPKFRQTIFPGRSWQNLQLGQISGLNENMAEIRSKTVTLYQLFLVFYLHDPLGSPTNQQVTSLRLPFKEYSCMLACGMTTLFTSSKTEKPQWHITVFFSLHLSKIANPLFQSWFMILPMVVVDSWFVVITTIKNSFCVCAHHGKKRSRILLLIQG